MIPISYLAIHAVMRWLVLIPSVPLDLLAELLDEVHRLLHVDQRPKQRQPGGGGTVVSKGFNLLTL